MSAASGPDIIENGLVLCLDAGNRQSYPGSGPVWTDLAGTNNGNLENGPTFNSANGGSIVFDGSDDYVVTPNYTFVNSGISNTSMFAWVYPKTLGSTIITYGQWADSDWSTGLGIRSEGYISWLMNGFPNDPYGYDKNYSTNFILSLSSWSYIGFVKNTTNVTICYNNSFVTFIPSDLGSPISTPNRFTIGAGSQNGSRGKYHNGYISHITAYNRALTPAEVLQNYNATKGRFLL